MDRLAHADAREDLRQAFREGWIKTKLLQSDKVALLLAATLDSGEAEAIALALESQADLILLDERDGRAGATRAGLQITGLLGALLRAKKNGQVESVWQELQVLRTRARFFVSSSLEARVLESAGE